MTDLLDFVRARLDEDERVAREALNHPGEWNSAIMRVEQTGLDDGVWSVGQSSGDECHIEGIGITIYDEGGHNEAQAKHIAEHDPARELREVKTKRLLLDEHLPQWRTVEWDHDQNGKGEALCCPRCQNAEHSEWNPPWGQATGLPEGFVTPYVLAPCRTLRALALPYSDHPDYREEWKP